MLRKIAYFVVIVFFGLLSFATYTFIIGANKAQESVVAPVGDLVRRLIVPVTPVILPNPTTIVREIKDLARLETASFEFEKVITAESNQDIFWGTLGESMVFVAYGKVFAGVDFAKMSKDDLQVIDPLTVEVYLPPAEIFADIPVLDNDKSFVADRDTGIFTNADPNLETQVRQSAERSIREAAIDSDILDRANFNAQEYMLNFLQGVGFENVIFTASRPDTAPAYVQPVPKGYAVTPESN